MVGLIFKLLQSTHLLRCGIIEHCLIKPLGNKANTTVHSNFSKSHISCVYIN